MSKKQRTWLLRGLTLVGILLGGWLLHRTASQYTVAEIVRSLRATPRSNILSCLAFAGASYLCLTINDWLALRYVGRPLPYRKAALAAFVSLSLGHNIGFAGLSSGAIRYRFYSRWGLSLAEVAKVVLFCGATVAMGLLTLTAAMLIAVPSMIAPGLHLEIGPARVVGVASGCLVATYLTLAFAGRSQISFRRWTLAVPPPHLALAQVLLGTINFSCVAACLHMALASDVAAAYIQVLAAYIVGNTATLLTHVPGGLGVIETAITYLVPHEGTSLGGGLVLFRLSYYLMPLTLGLIVLLSAEWKFGSGAAGRKNRDQGHSNGSAGSTKPVPNTGETGPSSATAKGTNLR